MRCSRRPAGRPPGEQVAGLFVRVHPFGEMPGAVGAGLQRAVVDQVAVGQQHRVFGLVGAQRHGVAGHHVGAVQEVGDAAEALGLALREEGVVADVETHQLGVLGRAGGGEDFQVEGLAAFGQVLQHQLVAFHLEGGTLAVDQHARQVQLLAVELERQGRHVRVAAQAHLVEHAGLRRVQVEAQVDGVYPVGGGDVVGAVDDHRGPLS
jgi:hypothetical protein